MFSSICGTQNEALFANTGKENKEMMPPTVFCGFSDPFEAFRVEERQDEEKSNLTQSQRSPNSEGEARFKIMDESYVELEGDDDSSVVSNSGVSVLSINYDEADQIVEDGEKVDLSEIGDDDDDSTVGSNEDETAGDKGIVNSANGRTSVDIKEARSRSNSRARLKSGSLARPENVEERTSSSSSQYVNKTWTNVPQSGNNIQSNSIVVKDNPRAESKRKELLKDLKMNISSRGRYSIPVAKSLRTLGSFHEKFGQSDVSVTLYQESLEIYSCKLGDHDTNVTDLNQLLGKGFDRLGEETRALQHYANALNMISDLKGELDLQACDIRVEISKILYRRTFFKEAVKELKKALRGYRTAHGDEHPSVAETVDLMACFYTDSGNHEKANTVRGELVKLMVALHGTKSLEVASSLEKWAMTHEDVGDLSGALRIMKQSYVMFHDIQSAECISAERTLEKIGYLYSKMGRVEKAIKAHTSVALARKNRCGDHSVELAGSYLNLGKAYINDSNEGRALKALTRAMTCYGKANESKNEYICELMDTLHTIGILHTKTLDYEKALKAFQKEKSVRQRYITYDDEGMIDAIKAVGETLQKMKKYSESKTSFVEAIQMIDRVEGRKIDFADTMRKCGESLEQFDENRAFTCYKESVQIFMANGYDEEHPLMKTAVLKLLALGLEDITALVPALRCSLIDGESQKFEF
jgi:tetratricopeptide (TPR) repeat protein